MLQRLSSCSNDLADNQHYHNRHRLHPGRFLGFYDTTTTAGRRKWIAKDITCWAGWIRGVSATMVVSGYSTAAYVVYVDSDSPVIPTRVDGIIQLFADKTDDWHFVNIHTTAAAAGGSAWTLTTGTLLTVYGDSPQYRPIGSAYITTDPDFPGHSVIPSQSPYPAQNVAKSTGGHDLAQYAPASHAGNRGF